MVDPPTEAALIGPARRGEAAAWEAIVRLHQEPVFRWAYLLMGDPDEAADVAQEAFIRAYRHLNRFDESRPLRPWLMRIAANLASNRRRASGRYWRALERNARLEPAPDPGLDPAEVQALWQAIRRLKRDDQRVIYLRYFLEVPESETAAVLHVARGTVKSRLHRALGRLRQVIEAEFPDLEAGLGA